MLIVLMAAGVLSIIFAFVLPALEGEREVEDMTPQERLEVPPSVLPSHHQTQPSLYPRRRLQRRRSPTGTGSKAQLFWFHLLAPSCSLAIETWGSGRSADRSPGDLHE